MVCGEAVGVGFFQAGADFGDVLGPFGIGERARRVVRAMVRAGAFVLVRFLGSEFG
jgi:hypothetical protein